MGLILKFMPIMSTGDEVSSPAHNKIMTDLATGLLLYFTYFSLHVYLPGFGSFIIKTRAEKTARNINKNTSLVGIS